MLTPSRNPYSINELAALHHLGYGTTVKLYENQPGVMIYRADQNHRKGCRRYRTIRVPEHVYLRVKHELESR